MEDYERYSLTRWQQDEQDEKIWARLMAAAPKGGDGEAAALPPPKKKKLTTAQKRKARAQREREARLLADQQAWLAAQQQQQQQEQREQAAAAGPLSAGEQAEYLDLLSRYQHRGVFNPTAAEQVEVLRLAELQLRVAAQQREFAQRWPHVPGLRPEVLTDGVASWSQARLAELLRDCPDGPWVAHDRQRVALVADTPVQPGLLGHIVHKAGVLVQPEPGCVLLPLPSPPGVQSSSASELEGDCPRPDGQSLLVRHEADLLVDLDTLLLDWHGRPWLLPCWITEEGRVCLGTVLPSGVHRDANRRFCNWLLEKWVQGQQEEEGAFGFPTGGTSQASRAPQEEDPVESADTPTEMDCLSGGSSPRSAELIIDEEGCGSSPRSGGLVIDDELEAKADGKEDTSEQAAAAQGEGGAWSVDLWELTPGGRRLLLQHQAWKCDTNAGSKLCTMVAKPEYQSPIGAEQWSGLERAEHQARLVLFPALLRVRVDVPSNEVLLVEQVERQPHEEETCLERLSTLFAPVAALLEQLTGLPPGPYLLAHDAGEASAKLLVPSESGDSGLNLHTELTRCFQPVPPTVGPGKRGGKRAPPPLPLDPQVVFPDHFRRGRIPLNLYVE